MTIRTETRTIGLEKMPDPISVMNGLAPNGEAVLFESPVGEGRLAERSFIFPKNALRIEATGANVTITPLTESGEKAMELITPKLETVSTLKLDGTRLVATVEDAPHEGSDIERIKSPSTADILRAICDAYREKSNSEAALNMPGVFAYDFMERFEKLPPARTDPTPFPDFVFFLPEVEIVLNNTERTAHVAYHRFDGDDANFEEIEGILATEHLDSGRSAMGNDSAEPICEVDMEDGEFAQLVSKLKDHVRSGDVFQIVPSRTFKTPCSDPTSAYRMLRDANPSPYMFFVKSKGFTLFGASPEACVRVRGNPRTVEIHPIAGTKPRGRLPDGEIDRDLDDRLEAELRLNEKELAEHMMLVDMARNDVARISRTGTRRVKKLCTLEKYSRVMHLVSIVEGELRDDIDALHAYIASTNMGTVVGAPKIKAASLLRKYESNKRGPYAGAVGYVTSDGEMDTAIVIRSALVRDGIASVRAGAGIVYDSDPHGEAQETRSKADAVLRAIAHSESGSEEK